jgi:hypothetical protein
MTLDIAKVYGQIEAMAADAKIRQAGYVQKIELALQTLSAASAAQASLERKLQSARTTWLVAGLKEEIDLRVPSKDCPANFRVVASDGSHIDVDRHQSTRLFLLNIGLVQLQYGNKPDASFSSIPTLYFSEEEMSIRSQDGRQIPIEGPLLGIKRNVEECRCLADSVCTADTDLPVIALVDGSLIMWGLTGQRYEDFVVEQMLVNGFLKQLERFASLNQNNNLAIASYISFPRSTDVVNLLRVYLCPYEPVDCDRHCKGKFEGRPCDIAGGLLDRAVFGEVLKQGERSAIFSSSSNIIEKYGAHSVCFFYLKIDEEVARVEVPLWVADNPILLDMVHAIVYDQCCKGFGYPVALSEAHEQAVVTGVDREQFWNLVDRSLAEDSLQFHGSLKQRSKKVKWI